MVAVWFDDGARYFESSGELGDKGEALPDMFYSRMEVLSCETWSSRGTLTDKLLDVPPNNGRLDSCEPDTEETMLEEDEGGTLYGVSLVIYVQKPFVCEHDDESMGFVPNTRQVKPKATVHS